MDWYDYVLLIVCAVIIVLSLLQGGKSEGASGAITGGGLNIFVKTKERGSEKIVSYLTLGFAICFLFLALLSTVLTEAPADSTETTGDATQTALRIITSFIG